MSSLPDRGPTKNDCARGDEPHHSIDWLDLERITHRDPTGRGLASYAPHGAPLDRGQLRAAACSLAEHAGTVGIVTGFCVRLDDEVTAETDGPPGALFLARALLACDIDVLLITDRYALPLLTAGCELWGLDRARLLEFPCEDGEPFGPARASNEPACNVRADRWARDFYSQQLSARQLSARGRDRPLTHLIAVERPGPSHTLESLAAQNRTGPPPLDRFSREAPAASRNICQTMRGKSINPWTAKTHRLFEWIGEQNLPIRTIGIGDGGNELGMGRFAWEELMAAGSGPIGQIACRIPTDNTLIAGVSDWGAYGLALAMARLRGAKTAANTWHARGQRELLEAMVRQTSAVDGLTLRHEHTVDGLAMADYLQPLLDMRRCLGFDAGET